jgi:hypothetical protein
MFADTTIAAPGGHRVGLQRPRRGSLGCSTLETPPTRSKTAVGDGEREALDGAEQPPRRRRDLLGVRGDRRPDTPRGAARGA